MSKHRSLLRFLSLALFAAGGAAAAVAAPKPSFNCATAASADERAICANPGLIALDVVANDGYLFLRDKLGKSRANKINLPLIKKRQSCGADAACIKAAQLESIAIFRKFGANLEVPVDRKTVVEKPPVTVFAAPPAPAEVAPPPMPAPRPQPSKPTGAAKEIVTTPPSVAPRAAPEAASPAEVAVATPPEASESPVEEPAPDAAGSDEARTAAAGTAAPPAEDATDEPPREIEGESVVPSSPAESGRAETATDAPAPEAAAPADASPATAPAIEKEVVETVRKKHLFAFILAGTVFAFLAFYLVRKLRGEHGAHTPSVTASGPDLPRSPTPAAAPGIATRASPAAARPETPPTRMNPGELRSKLTPPEPLGKSEPTASAKQKDDGSVAWVWSKYKGKL
jgi:hypothetical protein